VSQRIFCASESASALVEFALVLPFVLLLMAGVMEYARVWSTAIAVANAAKAAAQFGVQNTATSGDTAAINYAGRQDGLDAGSIAVTAVRTCRCADGATVSCVSGSCGAYGVPRVFVAATATKSVPFFLKLPGLPAAVDIRRTATLRVQ
jgi:Flp pilus assembly protein TadG